MRRVRSAKCGSSSRSAAGSRDERSRGRHLTAPDPSDDFEIVEHQVGEIQHVPEVVEIAAAIGVRGEREARARRVRDETDGKAVTRGAAS
jgi:hypothetical protein